MGESDDEKHDNGSNIMKKPSAAHLSVSQKENGYDGDALSIHTLHSLAASQHSTIADDQSHDIEATLERTLTAKKPIVKVPRAERRGLFARFCVVAEVTEPWDYPNNTKWFVTFVIAVAGAAAPIGSSIIFPTLDQVTEEFNSTPTVVNLSVALYMLSMAIFPLWWSAFSETWGRRSIYITSFALFILWSILSAISTSVGMLVVMRMLGGGAAASVQAVGAGTIADLFEVHERGRAMGLFYLGPLCGPLFAPILGGIVGEAFNWRATQWCLVIYGSIVSILIFFTLPETLKRTKNVEEPVEIETGATSEVSKRPPLSRKSTSEAVQQRSKKYIQFARLLLLDPLKVIMYLQYPPVVLSIYYASVTFGSLYVLNISITYTFEREPYNFSTLIVGLLYIPNSIGYIVSSLLGGRWMDYIMRREAIKAKRRGSNGKLMYLPEDRMRENAWAGAVIYPAALLWYGWTAEKGVFWLAPMVANFFYGLGSMLIFAMVTTMLTEFMPKRASSGVALNNLIRNIFSCVGSIVGAPLIDALGNGWLFTILGLWAFSSAIVIWAMKKFGPRWREKMDKALGSEEGA